jgi:hypothetical protein
VGRLLPQAAGEEAGLVSDAYVERIRAERAARGQAPTIQSPVVYQLLDAVLVQQAERENAKTN